MAVTAFIIPPDVPPERIVQLARTAETAGIPEVWLWEDCFAESGVAPAGAVLAATTQLRVGIGLLPVPLRNVALTGMEIATLARMFPGRLLPAIGHGVQSWMAQAGVRAASPLTMLAEHTQALRRILAGESVSTTGRYVRLDEVELRWKLEQVPPLYLGAEGPRTLELAGHLADGIVLSGMGDAKAKRAAVDRALASRRDHGVSEPLEVVTFVGVPVDTTLEALQVTVEQEQAAGATRVAILGLGAGDGPPEGGPALLDLVAVVGASLQR